MRLSRATKPSGELFRTAAGGVFGEILRSPSFVELIRKRGIKTKRNQRNPY
jgi:hypothetical protein